MVVDGFCAVEGELQVVVVWRLGQLRWVFGLGWFLNRFITSEMWQINFFDIKIRSYSNLLRNIKISISSG